MFLFAIIWVSREGCWWTSSLFTGMGKCAVDQENSLKEAGNTKEVVACTFSKYFNCLLVQGNHCDLLNAKAFFFFLYMFAAAGRWWDARSILSWDEWTTLKEKKSLSQDFAWFLNKILSSENFHMLVRLRHKKDIIAWDRFLFWGFQINAVKSSLDNAKRFLRYFWEQGWSVSSSLLESSPPWTLIFEGRGKELKFLHKSSVHRINVCPHFV